MLLPVPFFRVLARSALCSMRCITGALSVTRSSAAGLTTAASSGRSWFGQPVAELLKRMGLLPRRRRKKRFVVPILDFKLASYARRRPQQLLSRECLRRELHSPWTQRIVPRSQSRQHQPVLEGNLLQWLQFKRLDLRRHCRRFRVIPFPSGRKLRYHWKLFLAGAGWR